MYKRILLKLSGEALAEPGSRIIDVKCLEEVAKAIKNLHDEGVQIAVVIGAGNIWRGKLADEIGIDHVSADFMGMLGTVINAVAMASSLKKFNVESIVYSAIPSIEGVTLPYKKEDAIKSLEENKVTFLAGGTGKPFFTTDTAASLRALETNCQAILMAKNGVDGVFDKDPTIYDDARFLKVISYEDMIKMNLQVMDLSAVELIKDTDLEIRVFNMGDVNNFSRVVKGEDIGTTCKRSK